MTTPVRNKTTPAKKPPQPRLPKPELHLVGPALRTVVLYDRTRIKPETLEAIANSRPGELIPVERDELDSFMVMAVFVDPRDPRLRELDGN